MSLDFQTVPYDGSTFLENILPTLPKATAVYKIFDTHGQLIVLNKTSNLAERLERYFGPHSERVKHLDLRQITSRLEYIRTYSPFETAYTLYLERRHHFPKTYRRMKTFRYFTLMKINRKQRFPRVYASRQIKAGVDYFGPFISRGQFTRLKSAVERTFRLRPCPFNIRGSDPHPDCMYFQMHTCSMPCNNDIDRSEYLADVDRAMAFVQGNDEAIQQPWLAEMTSLAGEMRFEEAAAIRRKIERLQRARQEMKDTFPSLDAFDYVVILPSETTSRLKTVLVRGGRIAAFLDHEKATIRETLSEDLARLYESSSGSLNREWQYDEFCLVCSFMVKSLQSVQMIRFVGIEETVSAVEKTLQQKKKRPLPNGL